MGAPVNISVPEIPGLSFSADSDGDITRVEILGRPSADALHRLADAWPQLTAAIATLTRQNQQ